VPELPEVETVANGVHARIAGERITAVWTSGKPQTFKSPEEQMVEVLTGTWIEGVRRVGKSIVMDLSPVAKTKAEKQIPFGNDKQKGSSSTSTSSSSTNNSTRSSVPAQFLVHLGMTGRLLVSDANVPWPPHTHAVLTLSSGRELRFVDARRFGRLSVVTATEGYQGPGAEPTTISAEAFAKLFKGRRLAIKAALLNQSIVHGVGNIYADESLFRAGIRPRRQAGRLSRTELFRLHAALQAVLAHAIQLGGSSVSDYVDADGVRGFFQLQHKVYGRAGEVCLICATPLRKIVVGGRTTIYCPQCQM
jgi:formamidopyrimidine-DNA glycosylase